MDRDEVGLGEEPIELDGLDTEGFHALVGDEWVVGEHVHLEADGTTSDFGADLAQSHDAEDLVTQFGADVLLAGPLARAHGGVGLWRMPCEGHEEGDGLFGRGDRVTFRCVDDDDAAFGGSRDVDVIDADASAADNLELVGGFEDVAGDLGFATNDECVVVANNRDELIGLETGAHFDVTNAAEHFDAFVGDGVGYENPGFCVTHKLDGSTGFGEQALDDVHGLCHILL